MEKEIIFIILTIIMTQCSILDLTGLNQDFIAKKKRNYPDRMPYDQIINFQESPKANFEKWAHKYVKKYDSQEELIRLLYFTINFNIVVEHNKNSLSRYRMKLNKFGDLSEQQFENFYLMAPDISIQIRMTAPQPPSTFSGSKRLLQQDYYDWREWIQFGRIKNQGRCAACYAFADIGAIQLNIARKYSINQPAFSQQYVVDCCRYYGYLCNGCISGSMGSTIDFLARVGLVLQREYPYVGVVRNCQTNVRRGSYIQQTTSYYQISGLRNTIYYLIKGGPLASAVDSTNWKFYSSGVFDQCKTTNLVYSHSIVIIGIQADGSWIIRNSWGEEWGENGYGRIQGGNSCGILNYVFFPLIK